MKAQRFEDLIVWQKTRLLANRVFELTKAEGLAHEYKLVAQMRDAARSVMANIAEGFERRSRNEFHQAIVMAKGSAGEVRSDLYLCHDQRFITKETLDSTIDQCVEVSRLLEALRASLDVQRRKP